MALACREKKTLCDCTTSSRPQTKQLLASVRGGNHGDVIARDDTQVVVVEDVDERRIDGCSTGR